MREPAPKPKYKRRRRDETDKAFRMVVKEITLRRAVSGLAERARHFVWDTLHWLHLWESVSYTHLTLPTILLV